MPESIGKRISRLRQQQNWTQQDLAGRLAISRVAVSHIEMGLSIPSERTITLMAGIFKLTPHALVEGTTYPQAKAERLPAAACCYTAFELDMALLENDLIWLRRLDDLSAREYAHWSTEVRRKWHSKLDYWRGECIERQEHERLLRAKEALTSAISQYAMA